MQKWLLSWALTSLSVALAGCATPAEQQAETGLSDFEACDLRGASAAFANAHDLDPSRADFALAYALSTIAVLPENPAVTSVLLRLGFTSAIDTSALWGPGGVLDQLAAKSSTCQSVTDYLQAHIPYAPAQSNGPSAASVLRDPTLTGEDFAVAAADLVPILAKVVSALDQGAGAMGQFDIQGGCGVGTVHIEAPELYGLAAALELLVAVTDVAQAYDWGVPVSLVLDDSGQEQQYVAALNAHVLHLITPSALESGRLAGVYAMQLVQKGLTAAAQITTRPPNSLFDWTRVPAGVLSDVQTLTTWASQSLTTPGVMALPFFTPALSMDGHSFFSSPFDATNAAPPIWSVVPASVTGGEVGIDSSSTGIQPLLEPRFSPSPFASDAPSYSFGLASRWQPISSSSWTAAFDPDGRWQAAYGCN